MEVKLSCGILLFNKNGEMLVCHSTGKKWGPGTFDIPKGHKDAKDASELDTAVRELKEETGLDLESVKDRFEDLGRHEYVNGKDLYLFKYTDETRDSKVSDLKCTSFFCGKDDRDYPEVNGFKYCAPDKLDKYLFPSLLAVVKKLI